MDLQEMLFKKCLEELEKAQRLAENGDFDSKEYFAQNSKFSILYEFIEESGLMNQYEAWRKINLTSMEMEDN